LAPRPGVVQSLGRGNLSVASFCRVRGIRLVVGDHDATLPRGVIAPDAGVVGVAVASRNPWNITGSGTPEKSYSAYLCEVAGGSSLAEPWTTRHRRKRWGP
jgi:hypothetical protein